MTKHTHTLSTGYTTTQGGRAILLTQICTTCHERVDTDLTKDPKAPKYRATGMKRGGTFQA